ncbi:Gfo/Idh/MocA family protein [Egicoccus sp. AB-alg2]|uniref:Gfo/Idh/MocA family protein n=1 Tax=Egicoccus sp. AB-alg2 TaxID=3242693 RepID=UPI00359D7623
MTLRWGILGTGDIARAMAAAVRARGGEVTAVASADLARARAFADEHGVLNVYGRHHDLLARPEDVDVVYVATTNDRHHLDAHACIEAGVPALVEKPFTLDLERAEEVAAAARTAGVFVMEAMWMRFQPAFEEAERRIAAGQVGEPLLVQADFGIAAVPDRDRRWFARELGGGALLDVGIYPLTLVTSLLGTPTQAFALGELADTGVDASVSVAMRHGEGRLSSWSCSFVADTGIEATIAGSEGSLRIHGPFHHAGRLSLRRRDTVVEEHDLHGAQAGYEHEVDEVVRCLEAGRTESERMPLALTLTTMRWLDELRRQVGVVYPHED